jgi:hypothetical protein
MQDHLTETLPRRRPEWFDPEGMRRLFDVYQEKRTLGWPLWIFWGIYACDGVFAQDL